MTTITILPETIDAQNPSFRAMAGEKNSTGKTMGEALDALNAQLSEAESGTLVIVQQFRPDEFFTATQQAHLSELMTKWRAARDAGENLPAAEQAELEALVEAQLEGSARRTEAMMSKLGNLSPRP